jgi:hypothetical protein
MIEMKKLSAYAVINQHAYTIPLVYNSRGLASIRREGSMDSESEFDVEWQDMPDDFISDITEEEVEHIVEYLLAADVYLDDVDLTDDV